ncbi:MAG: Wadjet anti-phage system protein JetA family protein [Oscillospiraceae bacterium]
MCKDSPTYSSDKEFLISEIESYFWGINIDNYEEDDTEDSIYSDGLDKVPRKLAKKYIDRLIKYGWLDERIDGYQSDTMLSFNAVSIAISGTFKNILNPRLITYKGKLFKVSSLLNEIDKQSTPYETVLREVYDDMNNLNNSLRNLGASIATYIDNLTKNKTPQEVLDLFNEYEDKVVVASYHRFKTSDNLFNYKSNILEQLDYCRDMGLYKLAEDCANVEKIDYDKARLLVMTMIDDIENAVKNMSDIMREIDKQHILYRSRAVQRAQFLLINDSSIKGKINSLLKYYSLTISNEQDLFNDDDSIVSCCINITPQAGFSREFISEPIIPKKPTPIEPIPLSNPISEKELLEEQAKLLQYVQNATTIENINIFAQKALENSEASSASAIAEKYPTDFAKIICMHTYSEASESRYVFEPLGKKIKKCGYEFEDYMIRKKV